MGYPAPPGGQQPYQQPPRNNTPLFIALGVCLVVIVALAVVVVALTRGNTDASQAVSAPSSSSQALPGVNAIPGSVTEAVETTEPRSTTVVSGAGLFDKQRVSPGMCESNGVCRIASPSGNFMCYITPDSANCSAPQGEPLVAGLLVPLGGGSDREIPATSISVDKTGKTSVYAITAGVSKMETRDQLQPYIFPYGSQIQVLGFTCAMDADTGVSCRNDSTDTGFSVTRQGYTFF